MPERALAILIGMMRLVEVVAIFIVSLLLADMIVYLLGNPS